MWIDIGRLRERPLVFLDWNSFVFLILNKEFDEVLYNRIRLDFGEEVPKINHKIYCKKNGKSSLRTWKSSQSNLKGVFVSAYC